MTVQIKMEFQSLMAENSTPALCLFFTGADIEDPVHTTGNCFKQTWVFGQFFQILRNKQ